MSGWKRVSVSFPSCLVLGQLASVTQLDNV